MDRIALSMHREPVPEPADLCLGSDLLWRNARSGPATEPRGALFIDRDGVLIEEKIYLSDPAEVRLIPGCVRLIQAARARRIPVVVVTNQAGIARGRFGWQEFMAVERRVEKLLAEEGVALDGVFACPFHDEGAGVYKVSNHPWRKPNPGMLLEAGRLLNLDLGRSLLVGDKSSDIEAAKEAGLPLAIQVLTGHGTNNSSQSLAHISASFEVIIASEPSDVIPRLDEFSNGTAR